MVLLGVVVDDLRLGVGGLFLSILVPLISGPPALEPKNSVHRVPSDLWMKLRAVPAGRVSPDVAETVWNAIDGAAILAETERRHRGQVPDSIRDEVQAAIEAAHSSLDRATALPPVEPPSEVDRLFEGWRDRVHRDRRPADGRSDAAGGAVGSP